MIDPHQPSRRSPWTVESIGLAPIPSSDRYSNAPKLFWVWFAGNLSFAYLVIGAAIWSYGLSLWQSMLAILIGVASFWIIGYLGLPGPRTGLPTMAYSQGYFGRHGNRILAFASWINLLGWETVVLIIATYAIAAVFHLTLGVPVSAPWLLISLALSTFLELCIAYFGHALIESFQKWISYVFGLLTLVVLAVFLPHVAWHTLLSRPSGSWLRGMIPSILMVIAVSALSWVTTAADYTRHLPPSTSASTMVRSAALGAIAPTAMLMLAGVLFAQSAPHLASAIDPIQLLLHWIPAWAAIPYLLVTATGIIAGGIMCAYSSGLSLLAGGIRIPRSRTIWVDAAVSLAASIYIVLVSQNFLATFEAFLSLIACLLAPWAAIALVNVRHHRRPPAIWALATWALGSIAALTTIATPIFRGPLALGIFRTSSLGYVLGFALTIVLYAFTMKRQRTKRALLETKKV